MSTKLIEITVVDRNHVKLKYQKRLWFIDIGEPYEIDAYNYHFYWFTDNGKLNNLWLELKIDDAIDVWEFNQNKKK